MSAVRRPSTATHLALVAVQLMFASFGVVGKIALRELPATGLAAVRVLGATAVFAAVWSLRARERVTTRQLAELAVYAFFGIVANQLLFIGGLSRTTATHALVLASSIPVFTVGVAVVLGRERATPRKLVGLALALAGALSLTAAPLLLGGRAQGAADAAPAAMLVGDAMITLNSLSYAIYLVLSRRLLVELQPLTVMTFAYGFGMVGILPFGLGPLAAAAPHLHAGTWAAVAWIVAFPTVGAYLLNAIALRSVPASLVAIYIYLQSVVGALLAAAALGERPGRVTFVCAAAIFVGIWLVTRETRGGRPAPPPVA
jgi:drug/metabolite transporter (DMT)-like permease